MVNTAAGIGEERAGHACDSEREAQIFRFRVLDREYHFKCEARKHENQAEAKENEIEADI